MKEQVWSGSEMKVSADMIPYYTAMAGAGVSLRLKAVQITKLVEGGAGADDVLKDCPNIDETARNIVVEMVYQMGAFGVSKFKGMLKALSEKDYKRASYEMLDSLWARQTPNRAKRMSERMANIS